MTDDLHRREREIDNFWNALIRPAPGTERADVDAETADQIDRLQTLLRAQAPAGGSEQVRRSVLAELSRRRTHATNGTESPTNGIATDPLQANVVARPVGLPRENGRSRFGISSAPAAARVRPWAVERRVALIAATVLLLFTLGLGYWTLDPFSAGQNRFASIPAAVAPASPAAPSDLEVLLRVKLNGWHPSTEPVTPEPDGGSPQGDRVDLFRLVLKPSISYEDLMVDRGTRVLFVETGSIEAMLDGVALVVRARSEVAEPVGAESPVKLREGDALVTPGKTHQTLRADGASGATVLQLIEHRWTGEQDQIVASGPQPEELPTGPFVVTFTRLIVDPGGILPPLSDSTVAIVEVEEGSVSVVHTAVGVGTGVGAIDGRLFAYNRGGDVVVGAAEGVATEIRNTGAGPARLLVISFEPVVAAAGAAATPAE